MVDAAPRSYRWPAEWEPHRATWLAWPHERRDWPGKFAPIPWVYTEIIRQLHQCELVGLLVNDARQERQARAALKKTGVDLTRIQFHQVQTDRVWMRDSGPIFVKAGNGNKVALDWHFNGWAKYENHRHDRAVAERLSAINGWQRVSVEAGGTPIVLEGGSIDGNGDGLLLTTEECLLSDVQQRNAGFTAQDYAEIFATYLGTEKVLWLNRGIAGDDTHGHIDDLARFVGPRTIVAAVESNSADENYTPLQENLKLLRAMTDRTGQSFEIVPLPMPAPVYFAGQRLPASYANFYIANDRVLVPTFNDPNDRNAVGLLGELFRDRLVVGIHAVDLVWGLGTLHCMTQQEPS